MNTDQVPATPLSDDARNRIRGAASSFLRDAIVRLESAGELPIGRRSSPWLDHLTVRDVFGHDPGPELAAALLAEVPTLTDSLGVAPHRQAKGYPTALLRAVIAASLVDSGEVRADGPAAARCIDELIELVESPNATTRIVQIVTDVDADAIDGLSIDGVRFRSIRQDTTMTVSSELPEAVHEANRQDFLWHMSGYRGALLVAEATGPGDAWMLTPGLQARMYRVANAIRLTTAGTVLETMELHGQPSMVHVDGPSVFRLTHDDETSWRRRARLERTDLPGLDALTTFLTELDQATSKRISPLVIAIGRHARSLRPASWQDRVIDLSVGLEAALAVDNDREGLTLALRSRAAHLLALPNDPASRIFDDVGELYDIRSKVIHGRVVPEGRWTKLFNDRELTQVFVRDRLVIVLDRWRDLLRRAVIARLMLGAQPPIWPFVGGKVAIDSALVDPSTRAKWIEAVVDRVAARDLTSAWRAAEPLRDRLHETERPLS